MEMNANEVERLNRLQMNRADSKPDENKESQDKTGKSRTKSILSARRFLKKANRKFGVRGKSSTSIWRNMAYIPAIIAASFKDFLDIVIFLIEMLGIASVVLAPLAGVGVTLMTTITFCISIFIGFMLILAGMGGRHSKMKNMVRSFIRNILLLMFGTIAESIPVLSLFPIETLTILVIFFTAMAEKRGWKKS